MKLLKKKIEMLLVPGTEYYEIVREIIESPEFLKRKDFVHHESCSVFEHCLTVSVLSYLWTKRLNLDYRSAAIGGLLHDFYEKPWQSKNHKLINQKKNFWEMHGIVHAREALNNSKLHFPHLVNDKVDNIIKRHMFPLNITPPKYKEAWIVSTVDKYVSMDIFKSPRQWPKYLGLAKKEISH